jgi:hypothetical protein
MNPLGLFLVWRISELLYPLQKTAEVAMFYPLWKAAELLYICTRDWIKYGELLTTRDYIHYGRLLNYIPEIISIMEECRTT